jgi:hypothetical protein
LSIDRENRTYAFFESEIATADFVSVDYGPNDAAVVRGQGCGDYFCVYLTATKLGEVSVEYREQDARGGDARALHAASFPVFRSRIGGSRASRRADSRHAVGNR